MFNIKITLSEICIEKQEQMFYNCVNKEMEGRSMETTYDKIMGLLKKASDRQLNLIYRFVKGLLKD